MKFATNHHKAVSAALLLLPVYLFAQDNRAFNQNSARSNNTRAFNQNSSRSNNAKLLSTNDSWAFGVGTGASFGVNSNENTLFRGNSIATKMFGQYNLGNAGLGFTSGIIPGSINSSALNSFMIDRKFPSDLVQVSQTKPISAYLLFGPSIRFGKRVEIMASGSGGIFYNTPGAVSINQQGATRALYKFDAGSKNIFPGFSGTIKFSYPIKDGTKFFINSDYLQSQSSIRILDPQRGIDVPTEQTRPVKLFTAGIGIIKTFGAPSKRVLPTVNKREIAIDESGVHRNAKTVVIEETRRVLPTVNKREIAIDEPGVHRILSIRDVASGQATGRRVLPTVNKREISIDESGVHSALPADNCGPVTVKKTMPDGSTEEKTFSCPADMRAYEKQSDYQPWEITDSDERIQPEQENVSTGSTNNIVAGRVLWSLSAPAGGIVTNRSAAASLAGSGGGAAAASYAATGLIVPGTGVTTNIYVRDVSSGQATGKRSREVGSGMATGRRQYQPVFTEGGNNVCNPCMAIITNNTTRGGSVTMNSQTSSTRTTNQSSFGTLVRNGYPANDCGGVAGLTVYLLNKQTRATVATTQTEICGEFFFANVPDGNYVVKVAGGFSAEKNYDAVLNKRSDVAGEIIAAEDYWSIDITTDTGSVEHAQAVIKTKTKSNQSNDRLVNTSRSNIKNIIIASGDLDGDGMTEILVGNNAALGKVKAKQTQGTTFGEKANQGLQAAGSAVSQGATLVSGNLPSGPVLTPDLMPGSPIGGLSIKGGKNPGGNLRTTQTNAFGEFEFTDLEEGSYTFTADLMYYVDDETTVSLGNEMQTRAQDYNSSRSNKTASKMAGNSDEMQTRAQDYNSSRSNKTASKMAGNSDEMQTRVQDHNSSRSNKSSSIMAGNGDEMQTRVQDHNSSRSNKSSSVSMEKPDADGSNPSAKSGINGINNQMPNRISMNVTVPKQTQGSTFGDKMNGRDNDPNNQMKAQNNNTVRSNRTDNAIVIADLDGDGEMESSYMNINGEVATISIDKPGVQRKNSGIKQTLQTQVFAVNNKPPVKWTAPEAIDRSVWGDPHVDEKEGRLITGGASSSSVAAGKWNSTPVAIKKIECADGVCVIITANGEDIPATTRIGLNGLPPGQPVSRAAVWFTSNNGVVYKKETDTQGRLSLNGLPPGQPLRMMMNAGVAVDEDIIIVFSEDGNGNAISNVLKTKHDTAKNAIGNIR